MNLAEVVDALLLQVHVGRGQLRDSNRGAFEPDAPPHHGIRGAPVIVCRATCHLGPEAHGALGRLCPPEHRQPHGADHFRNAETDLPPPDSHFSQSFKLLGLSQHTPRGARVSHGASRSGEPTIRRTHKIW